MCQLIFSFYTVEIRRTPIGDGNSFGNVVSIYFFILVEIRRTPIGDGNKNIKLFFPAFHLVEIRRTPIGDGNATLNWHSSHIYSRNKKNPDRGRKLVGSDLSVKMHSLTVEIRRTPIGDGNEFTLISRPADIACRNKKNPDRGRKQ